MNRSSWLNLFLFLASAILASFLANGGHLPIAMDHRGSPAEFRYYARNHRDFDVVFLGSSFTAHQVDALVFDQRCAERGHPLRSINLAQPGAPFYRVDDELRRVLALRSGRLRFIIMDLRAAPAELRDEDRNTAQAIRWHTPLQTRRVLRRLWSADLPARIRRDNALAHLSHLGRNFFQVFPAVLSPDPAAAGGPIPGRDFPYFESTGDVRANQAREFQRKREAFARMNPDECLAQLDLPALTDQIRLLRDHRVRPVFVAPPSLKCENLALRYLEAHGLIPPAIFLDNPAVYPWLFELRNRHIADCNHLARTRETIGNYSRLLADRFVDLNFPAPHTPPAHPGQPQPGTEKPAT